MATPTIRGAFVSLNTKVTSAATNLNNQIAKALDQNDLDPMQMLELQFNMGRFNAMVEATSSVTKGLTDTAKTLAQRAGG
jgi:type III secretion protein F